MDTLRSEVESIIIDHFDPSIMGRTQAVDDIMAAIAEHNDALANRTLANRTAPSSQPATGVIRTSMPEYVVHIDPASPPKAGQTIGSLLHEERRRTNRGRGAW